jgi:hypothetical protein
MVVGVMKILVLIKFLNVKFISVKIGDPITLGSSYVKICPYVRYFLHMSRYVHILPLPNIWTNLVPDVKTRFVNGYDQRDSSTDMINDEFVNDLVGFGFPGRCYHEWQNSDLL